VFRLAVAVLEELQVGRVWLPVTYFALWMSRLLGWMPELGRCVTCGLDLRGTPVWWSSAADGVTCADDRRAGSVTISAQSVAVALRMYRGPVKGLASEEWPRDRAADLRRFAIELLERHLEERLASARALA
jgi:DNA repair protein RecO (recombination protein O)